MSEPAIYSITLRTEPGQAVPPDVRLRQLLKSLLRQWGFRAVEVRAIESEAAR
jgi:hypothetical protein